MIAQTSTEHTHTNAHIRTKRGGRQQWHMWHPSPARGPSIIIFEWFLGHWWLLPGQLLIIIGRVWEQKRSRSVSWQLVTITTGRRVWRVSSESASVSVHEYVHVRVICLCVHIHTYCRGTTRRYPSSLDMGGKSSVTCMPRRVHHHRAGVG